MLVIVARVMAGVVAGVVVPGLVAGVVAGVAVPEVMQVMPVAEVVVWVAVAGLNNRRHHDLNPNHNLTCY